MARRGTSVLPRASARRGSAAPATDVLLAITVAVHLAGLLRPAFRQATLAFAAQDPIAVGMGEWHRLLTSAFVHATSGQLVVWHVAFNMVWLWYLGRQLEPRVGSAAFTALYLAAAAAGGAGAQLAWHGGIGASGAVYGLLGVLFVEAVRTRHDPEGRRNLRAWGWLLALGFSMPLWAGPIWGQIGWAAHLGGFAGGLLVGVVWRAADRARAPGALRVVTAVGVGALSLVVALGAPTRVVGDLRGFKDELRAAEAVEAGREGILRDALAPHVVSASADPPATGFAFDPRTLALDEDAAAAGWWADFLLVRTDELDAARRGLAAASERWYLVDDTGREWPSIEALDAAFDAAGPDDPYPWTVPYVSEVEAAEGGLAVHVDLEAAPLPPLAQARFLTVLVEELERAGVTRAHVTPLPRDPDA